ncbi:MAG: UDP-N-acetylmuramate dehydrogenase [Acidobacteriota bacterium]|jgi:UDP-N-acetylmuramate dehydrogenase
MNTFDQRLVEAFGAHCVGRNVPLAPLTTFKVGGPAEWLITLQRGDDVQRAMAIARTAGVPVTPLGGGSNVLVADAGVEGLVLRLHGGDVVPLGPSLVRADAGVTINGLVRWTVGRGLAGLEAWAGTPGTLGGAVFGNAHFRGRLISELIERVRLVTPNGALVDVPARELEFAYDFSRLQRTGEVVVSADLRVTTGDPVVLRAVARDSLAFRKRTQPLEAPSAGCIFQNPQPSVDAVPEGIPYSAGALVDRAGLKSAREGGALVSATHANFIVNEGGASADEIRSLIRRCKADVRKQFGVTLREEIVYLGWPAERR